MDPYVSDEGELRLRCVRYLPHRNCAKVSEFLGLDPEKECDGEGPSDVTYVLPDGTEAQPGQWITTLDGKTFQAVDHADIQDLITGTRRTVLAQ